jgi:hypothetical protein
MGYDNLFFLSFWAQRKNLNDDFHVIQRHGALHLQFSSWYFPTNILVRCTFT